jgi:malic enzyme
LRGAAYDELIEAFVAGVLEVWPGCLIQWEDFKQHIALQILDRYRDRICSFNDDIQGTAAVVLGGLLAGARLLGQQLADQRIVIAGAGAAGIGITRLIRLALRDEGVSDLDARAAVALVDSHGLVHDDRAELEDDKRTIAWPAEGLAGVGLDRERPARLEEVVAALRPTILLGATGRAGTFDQALISRLAAAVERPIVMPLSNPTVACEAQPADLLRWSDGRAIVATGSPFQPVIVGDRTIEIGQANNVFVFPGLGLGAIVAEARTMPDEVFLAAARALDPSVTDDRLAAGALYPPVAELRSVTRTIATAVARTAVELGIAGIAPGTDPAAAVDGAMWWPRYAPYVPAADRRMRGH